MDIVCACDEKFIRYTTTMLCSLLANNVPPINIHFIHGNIPKNIVEKLQTFIQQNNGIFFPYRIDDGFLYNLKVDLHASIANYYRLLIPEILPITINKVLYLDSDLIVRKAIDDLWNINIENYYLAAAENLGIRNFDRLFMPKNSRYFNSGVMLVNVEKWRREGIHNKVLNFIRNYPDRIKFWDQDGLNAILYGKWKVLPIKWNVQHNYFFPEENQKKYAEIILDPAIVHFSGDGLKPWQPNINHKFKIEYLYYESKIPFALKKHFQLVGFKQLLKRIPLVNYFAHLIIKVVNIISKITQNKTEVRNIQNIDKHESDIKQQIVKLIPDFTVASGPFKGLRYGEIKSIGSTLAPKFLGTYEAELHGVIEDICSKKYSTIINIGCAEGYYAIGLALRNAMAKIYAYDIDSESRRLCRSMAEINNVSDRVSINEHFIMATLLDFNRSGDGLILSDCEGAEASIFYKNEDSWRLLTENYDLLIEIHEFIKPGVSNYLKKLFTQTYKIKVIRSIDDLKRPTFFPTPLLENQTIETKIRLMAEKRPSMMEWFYLKRKVKAR